MTDAFTPIPRDALAPEAALLHDRILASRAAVADKIGLVAPDGSLRGPFGPLLHTPELGDVVQRLGVSVRSDSTLSPRVSEVVILTVVDAWECQFEWSAHCLLSAESGVLGEVDIRRLASGLAPSGDDAAVEWAFARQQCLGGRVDDATMAAALARFGERGVVELTLLVGYYAIVCMLVRTCTRDDTETGGHGAVRTAPC